MFKAVPTAPPQWNIYIVIKESGCEDVRHERSKSEDEGMKNSAVRAVSGGEQELADDCGRSFLQHDIPEIINSHQIFHISCRIPFSALQIQQIHIQTPF